MIEYFLLASLGRAYELYVFSRRVYCSIGAAKIGVTVRCSFFRRGGAGRSREG